MVPFYELRDSAQVVLAVMQGKRPTGPNDESWKIPLEFWTLMQRCWDANPSQRPTADEAVSTIEALVDPSNTAGLTNGSKVSQIQEELRRPSPLVPSLSEIEALIRQSYLLKAK